MQHKPAEVLELKLPPFSELHALKNVPLLFAVPFLCRHALFPSCPVIYTQSCSWNKGHELQNDPTIG